MFNVKEDGWIERMELNENVNLLRAHAMDTLVTIVPLVCF